MPPIKKYTKEEIINTSYEIVKNEGFKALNARRIAKELNSSIQPIFHNFKTIEDLKKDVYNKIYEKYQSYINDDKSGKKSYKKIGLAYIKFAKDYKEFFKIIFMQKTNLNALEFIESDNSINDVIKTSQELTHLNDEEAKKFHLKVWIFTHGLACLVATDTIQFQEKEIEELLEKTVREMLIGYRNGENNEKHNWSKKINKRI